MITETDPNGTFLTYRGFLRSYTVATDTAAQEILNARETNVLLLQMEMRAEDGGNWENFEGIIPSPLV